MKGKNVATVVLAIASVIGVAVTTYMCAKEAPEAREALKEAEEEFKKENTPEAEVDNENFTVEMTIMQKAKVILPHYVKTAIAGGITVLMIIGGHIVHVTLTASALAGAYAWQKRYIGLDDIVKKKAREMGLDGFHKEVKTELAKKEVRSLDPSKQIMNKSLRELNSRVFALYDPASRQLIYTTNDRRFHAEKCLNMALQMKGKFTQNEWLKALGGKPIDGGNNCGWSLDDGEQMAEASFDVDGNAIPGTCVATDINLGKFPETGETEVLYIYYNTNPKPFDEVSDISDYAFG